MSMIPSSPGGSFSSFELPSDEPEAVAPAIKPIDSKAQSLADKFLSNINEVIAAGSTDDSHAYYIEQKDSTPPREIFETLMKNLYDEAEVLSSSSKDEDTYNEMEMMEGSVAVIDAVTQDPIKVEVWSDDRVAWEGINFHELLDNVVEARKEAYSHDFRAFVERVASSVGLSVRDLMPNESDDIVYVHEAWKKLSDMRSLHDIITLDLSGLNLHALPPEVSEMDNLEELILSNNKLLTLPKEVGNLSHLKRLLVDYNVLKSVPKELGDLVALVELDLSNNRLEKIPESFGKLVNLQTLDLSVNRLKGIPHELEDLKHLDNLVVYGNRF